MLHSHHDILAMLASELDEARVQLEALGMALCSQPELVAAQIHHLQSLDHVGQRCASIAAILRSDDLSQASRMANLESIASRSGPKSTQCGGGAFYEF